MINDFDINSSNNIDKWVSVASIIRSQIVTKYHVELTAIYRKHVLLIKSFVSLVLDEMVNDSHRYLNKKMEQDKLEGNFLVLYGNNFN